MNELLLTLNGMLIGIVLSGIVFGVIAEVLGFWKGNK